MSSSTLNNNETCPHDGYCSFSGTLCRDTDFKEHCHMKETPIEDMPLLNKVKERVERDAKRQSN